MTAPAEPSEPAWLCSHCRFPIRRDRGGLRHYGTHTAHPENECLQLLHAEIDRLKAALVAHPVPQGKPVAWMDREGLAMGLQDLATRPSYIQDGWKKVHAEGRITELFDHPVPAEPREVTPREDAVLRRAILRTARPVPAGLTEEQARALLDEYRDAIMAVTRFSTTYSRNEVQESRQAIEKALGAQSTKVEPK